MGIISQQITKNHRKKKREKNLEKTKILPKKQIIAPKQKKISQQKPKMVPERLPCLSHCPSACVDMCLGLYQTEVQCYLPQSGRLSLASLPYGRGQQRERRNCSPRSSLRVAHALRFRWLGQCCMGRCHITTSYTYLNCSDAGAH